MDVLKSISFHIGNGTLDVAENEDGEVEISLESDNEDMGICIPVEYADFFEIVRLLAEFAEEIKPDDEQKGGA